MILSLFFGINFLHVIWCIHAWFTIAITLSCYGHDPLDVSERIDGFNSLHMTPPSAPRQPVQKIDSQ
ncbi:hypothetical protein CPB86DRAFT_453122 [Serendipita vermifera]|nr:hypothetical protein CPB86DRAFT_453122 [Serendipita vermifera]